MPSQEEFAGALVGLTRLLAATSLVTMTAELEHDLAVVVGRTSNGFSDRGITADLLHAAFLVCQALLLVHRRNVLWV